MVEPFPRFRQRVIEGRGPLSGPHWEDDPTFDLDLHIHRAQLLAPGDRAALQAYVADLMATPLDRSQPLWQFHLVDGYGEGGALVSRIHHCIADGIALGRVLLSLTDESPDAGIAPVDGGGTSAGRGGGRLRALTRPVTRVTGAARDVAGTMAHEAIEVGRHPSHLRDLAASGRADAGALARVLLKGADEPTALKGDLEVARRVAWSSPFQLDRVKAFGHATGTTVNDVVLTAVAGALRDHLRSRGSLVDEVTAFVPFNLRPLDQPRPAELGNRFGLVFLRLPIGIEAPRQMLDEVHRRMEEIKHSPDGAIAYGVLDVMGRTPVRIERRLVDLFSTKGTAVITNVPGPRRPVYLGGTPVRGVLVWAPCSGGVSTSVSIFSYAGEITVGLMVDAGLVPDPDAIVTDFERGLESLCRA
jgi:WS/DGAT/MGAT family acyltransferase